MAKNKKPKAEDEDVPELTSSEKWQMRFDKQQNDCQTVIKLNYLFYELYPLKEIKERPELQYQIQLYRNEGARLAVEGADIMIEMWKLRKAGLLKE